MSSWDKKQIAKEAQGLCDWYAKNSRPLPWRESRDPYPIWISEVMLQQTTSTAVIPFFQKFMGRFPSLKSLATAPLSEVYKYWAGLGYYSRARNIHKAAQLLAEQKQFPKGYAELIEYPGFGDYTARAVTSQAFGEPVGVVDGNVIRVLSRRFGLALEYWKTPEKRKLQEISDTYAQAGDPNIINQSLMELGATICTPQSPTCLLCPLRRSCVAFAKDLVGSLPLKKPRRIPEIWHWQVEIYEKNGKFLFIKNEYAPFLKKQWILPGQVKIEKKIPKNFDFQHMITHHKIYVSVLRKKSGSAKHASDDSTWIAHHQLKEKVPFSIIQKTIETAISQS